MPAKPALLYLCRHGETVWHAENRYAGISDIELSEEGRRQADRLGSWAARHRPTAVVCSPLSRARETAAPSAAALRLPLEAIDDLAETGFGIVEGRTLDELRADDPDAVAAFLRDPARFPFHGSEPPLVAAQRGAAALRALAERYPDGRVLVVAHNTLLRLALCSLLGIDVGRYRAVFPRLDNTALTELRLAPGGPAALLNLNVPVPRVD